LENSEYFNERPLGSEMKKIVFLLILIFLSGSCNQEVYIVSTPKGCDVYNRKGKVVFSAGFDLLFFSDGLAEFDDTLNKIHGYIKENGKIAFLSDYSGVAFSEGLGSVFLSDSSCGFINKKGQLVLRPQYKGKSLICQRPGSSYFHEGRAGMCFRVNDSTTQTVYIAKNGKVAFDKEFIGGGDFNEGLASVWFLDSTHGYIDRRGHVKIMLPAGHCGDDFSEGLAWIDEGDSCYLINKNGQTICEKKFLRPWNFHNGRAEFKIEIDRNIFSGFINRKCETVIEPVYYQAFNFSDGLATMSKRVKNKYGHFDTYVLDVNGNVVLGPYRNVVIREFHNGVAPAQTRVLGDTCFKTFYITKKGKIFGEATHCYED